METGWIKLNRKIKSHWIWQDPEKLRAWLDLIMSVNHEQKKILVENQLIELQPGQMWTSVRSLSDRWKWSHGKVLRFLDLLEQDSMLNAKRTRNGTLVTIVNYGKYQLARNADEYTNGNADGTQTERNKNDKNVKEGKEEREPHSLPPRDELQAFILSNQLNVDADWFLEYYQDDPPKDWKRTAKSWSRNEKPKQDQSQKPKPGSFMDYEQHEDVNVDEMMRRKKLEMFK